MNKVIGFDLDDTLVPEVLFIRSGIHHTAQWLQERLPSLPQQRIITRMEAAVMARCNHYSALEDLLTEFGLSDTADMSEIVTEFRSHLPDPDIYHVAPSIFQLLKDLKREPSIKLILITDGRSLTQRNKIKTAGLNTFFENNAIYISEETGTDKTKPDTFIHIMEKYAGTSEFHYVGDNPPKDFLHPSRLGWHTHRIHQFPLMIHHQGMPR